MLASWNAIKARRKVFYSLFLVQQTAMFGVFVSLDLMVYYGFWELSLVPMAILIAMYGRKDGPHAALKFFLSRSSLGSPAGRDPLALRTHRHLRFRARCSYYIAAEQFPQRALLVCAGISIRLRGKGAGLPAARLARRNIL